MAPMPQFKGLHLTLTLSKCFGVFPNDKTSKVYSYFIICLVVCGIISFDYSLAKFGGKMYSALYFCTVNFECFLFISLLLRSAIIYDRDNLRTVFRQLELFHLVLESYGNNIVYSRRSYYVAFSAIALAILMAMYYSMESIELFFIGMLRKGIPLVSAYLLICQYTAVLDLARDQLTILVDQLKYKDQWLMETLVDIHCAMIVNLERLHGSYSEIVTLGVSQCSFSLLCSSYYLISGHKKHYAAFFTFIGISRLVLLVTVYEQAKQKAEAFNVELFRLMRESKDLCRNDKLHLYVTMKQTVNFTACGFFNLGYPLVTSIIAAATTYLVILVQFSMPAKTT